MQATKIKKLLPNKPAVMFMAACTLVILLFSPMPARAATPAECPDGFQFNIPNNANVSEFIQQKCANHQTGTSAVDSNEAAGARIEGTCKNPDDISKDCAIVDWLVTLINVLSGLVGIIIVIMIIWGGIEYSMSGNDPQKVAAAKSKIVNALLALFIFIFMFAFLQWIVPGGIFSDVG